MKKILIVGCGGIGKRHIDGFLRTGKCRVSVCDIDNEKLQQLENKYPLDSLFTDFFSVDISKFDAVLIATPANQHIKMAKRCCQMQVPFLLEKPLAVTLEGVDELIDMSKKSNIVCAVGYTRRSIPSFKKFKQLADSGMAGEIKMANFYCGQDYRKYRPDYSNIYFSRRSTGGGVLRDFVTHFIDLAQWILGKPKRGFALTANLVFGNAVETDDSAIVIGEFAGKLANFYCNGFQKPNELVIDLAGTKGNLKYTLATRFLSKILFSNDDSGNWQEIVCFHDEIFDYYLYQAQEFLKMLDGEICELTTLEEAAENLKFIIDVIERSKD
ncbi:MAG: Gfo/Idh/MocA family oxidoreductase [Candidatus Omnitrophica bacterium]|nr:Gfo/Idh/MocA family oxidoreductase [Candidatus Omnitrophota bacterium]